MAQETKKKSIKHERFVRLALTYFVVFIVSVIIIYPLVWTVGASLNPGNSLMSSSIIPENVSFEHYEDLFNGKTNYLIWYWNSLKISVATMVLTLIFVSFTAYSFSRFRFTGRKNGLMLFLLLQMIPQFSALIAIFVLSQMLGLVNSHLALILIYVGGMIPMNTYLMKGYLDAIPKDLDESARMEANYRCDCSVLVHRPIRRLHSVDHHLTYPRHVHLTNWSVQLSGSEDGCQLYHLRSWCSVDCSACSSALPVVTEVLRLRLNRWWFQGLNHYRLWLLIGAIAIQAQAQACGLGARRLCQLMARLSLRSKAFALQSCCCASCCIDSIVLHALGFTGAVKLSACSTGLLLVFAKAGYKLTCGCARILRACSLINRDGKHLRSDRMALDRNETEVSLVGSAEVICNGL